MSFTRTFDLLFSQQKKFPNKNAIVSRHLGQWVPYSCAACLAAIDEYSLILLNLGVKKGDRVVLVPHLASAEWIFLDFAIQQIGGIVVPVHITSQPDQLDYILAHTAAKLCFLGNQALGEQFFPSASVFDQLQLFYLDEPATVTTSLAYLRQNSIPPAGVSLATLREDVAAEDLSAIIYTSGTTGIPKGVMLSHNNIVSNVRATLSLLPVEPGKIAISFLPFSHIFERMAIYTYLASGVSLYTIVDREYLSAAFLEVRPHIFTAVPRILEKMYDQVLATQVEQSWRKRSVMAWALKIGMNFREQPGLRLWYWLKLQLAKILVLNRLKRNLGGRVHAIVVGAAYMQPALGRLMAAMGIKAREGYGMTETAAAATINRFEPGLYAFGTVGLPTPGVQIKIDDPNENGEGEVLIKGPNVMLGYYKQPEETKQVLSADGWLRSGDIGKFVKKRFLQITDRKKDIFKTSSGKYISPLVLENHFKQSPFIEQCMVLGFQRPYVTALIHPNVELLEAWCHEHHIHWTSPQYMVLNIKVRQQMQAEIDRLNAQLPNYETIRAFHLFHEEWTIESGLLTYTMKLIRPKILEKFRKEVDELYKV
ncbi:MAG: long-chain fatty acid--CoA ligase [Saprospiraceae bacterium]